MEQTGRNRTLAVGLLIILIGLAFLLRQMDVFTPRVENVLFSWQMLLILLGSFFLAFSDNKTTGFILIIIGAFFILPEIYVLPYNFRRTFWPILLIVLGIFVLTRSGLFRRNEPVKAGELPSDTQDFFDEVNIFSGSERRFNGANLRGGKITSIFGGSEMDLRGATLSSGTNVIEVFYMFGGSSITVPQDWQVVNKVTAVLGGFSDKRVVTETTSSDPSKTIVLRGLVIFGGGEIRS
jgi:predicted membrane protein